jgi:hypothetical protein
LLAGIALAASGHAGAAGSFPCRWNWDLQSGLRTGYVTAGNSADCAGRGGSLTLGVRLLRRDPATPGWKTAKRRTRTFHHLSGSRFVEVATPCVPARFRAVMRWTLRDARGAIVARHVVRTGTITVPSPDCRVTIG